MKSQVQSLLRPLPGHLEGTVRLARKQRKRVLPRALGGLAAVAALLLPGCYRATVYTGAPATAKEQPPHRHTEHYFVFGLVGAAEVDVRDDCGSRPAVRVRTYGTPGTVLALVATLGVYTPRRVAITCAADAPLPAAPSSAAPLTAAPLEQAPPNEAPATAAHLREAP